MLSGVFAVRKLLWQKLSERQGELTLNGNVSPAEMLIAKERWEVSERSISSKTTKKLVKNDKSFLRMSFPS